MHSAAILRHTGSPSKKSAFQWRMYLTEEFPLPSHAEEYAITSRKGQTGNLDESNLAPFVDNGF